MLISRIQNINISVLL